MSTRAVYTFKDNEDTFHVYKHYDGYPEGALQFIENGLKFGSGFGEASDAAASFIAANKSGARDIYLSHGPEFHGDLEYFYIISPNKASPLFASIDVYKVDFDGSKKLIESRTV